MMLVCSQPMMMLGMIVIRVQVDVQRRDLAAAQGQDRDEQDRDIAMHNGSVCKGGWVVKRG